MKCNCIELGLQKLFSRYGSLISKFPWPCLIFPLFLAAWLGAGFIDISFEKDIEVLYVPQNAQSLDDRKVIEDLYSEFGDDNLLNYQRTRLGLYGQVLLQPTEGDNALMESIIQDALDLHEIITNITIEHHDVLYSYKDLCLTWHGTCYANGILEIIKYNATLLRDVVVTYPYYYGEGGQVFFLGNELGGVSFAADNNTVTAAEIIQLTYNLRYDTVEEEERSVLWENAFLETVKDVMPLKSVVYRRISHSLEQEVDESSKGVISLFAITFTILINFSIWSCVMLDWVRSKPWLAFLGVVSAGLAVVSAFGVMCLFKVPYINQAGSIPFLILGIGVDDMFIMIAAWRQTNIYASTEDRMSKAFSEAAMSITITSITDALAFGIGAISPFESVRIFCAYAGLAVAFAYLYQITFFAACMVITGNREANNRHAMTCRKVRPKSKSNSKRYQVFCAGGSYSFKNKEQETDRLIEKVVSDHVREEVVIDYVLEKLVTDHGLEVVVTGRVLEEVVTDHVLEEVVTSHSIKEVVAGHSIEEMEIGPVLRRVVTVHSIEEVVTDPVLIEVVIDSGIEKVVADRVLIEVVTERVIEQDVTDRVLIEVVTDRVIKQVVTSDCLPEQAVTDHVIMSFFKKYYGPFLTNSKVLILVGLLYCIYLGFAVWGVFGLEYGLDLTKLLPDNSYASPYFEKEPKYFTHYGPVISVVVSEEIDYWEESNQRKLEETLTQFEKENQFFHDKSQTISWLRDYKSFLNNSNPTEDKFYKILKETFLPLFIHHVPNIVFKPGSSIILSSRSYVTSKDVNDTTRELQVMQKARSLAKQSDIKQIAYHPAFTFYDQYTAVIPNTVQNMCIAMGAMFIISFLMIPIGSPIVAISVASILIGVIGYMSWWNIALDTISMINLILCIGFSVDFCAHITYVFFATNIPDPRKRTINAMYTLGMPILQGACSTILGVVVLAFSNSYIFRSFFKTMLLVISFGALHGLVFLPAFLMVMGSMNFKQKYQIVPQEEEVTNHQNQNKISNKKIAQYSDYQNPSYEKD